MADSTVFIGQNQLHLQRGQVKGYLTEFDGEAFYCIRNYDLMQPFLMSIVSNCDLWMYISSGGGLTAGRRNFQNVLFPYETDDRIHESSGKTGSKTIIRISEGEKMLLWEPFSPFQTGMYKVRRNLYKNTPGNKVIFEEVNDTLKLNFLYSWSGSDALGWVRKSTLINLAERPVEAEICDGLLNVLPWGINRETHSLMSTLLDAYKVGECLPDGNLALYYLSSIPVDRAEPSEALRTNTVWSVGGNAPHVLLRPGYAEKICQGQHIEPEKKVYGQKTAYLVHDTITLKESAGQSWYIIADVAKDSSEVQSLKHLIEKETDRVGFIESALQKSKKELEGLVSLADGVQRTGDPLNDRRHFANVLFNIMRGGVFEREYTVSVDDFLAHLADSNQEVYEKHKDLFHKKMPFLRWDELLGYAMNTHDDDFYRLSLEYLPLSFSRRHGDPSRPWNFFDIRVKNDDGSSLLNYQGNWRDIFQNWEALAYSFPAFLPGMISRFLNASTADGYNPYRLTREGFDWEVPEPDNPWAGIGYWGDHQVIYLLKLLELQEKISPGQIWDKLNGAHFVFAKVPYRIKSYQDILKDPQDTIVFDTSMHEKLLENYRNVGADGKLILEKDKTPLKATFVEKILVLVLTKISNFVPEAGIWLNTQRPEWNDANNALVGNGTSMVTLYHLRRFVSFLTDITNQHPEKSFTLKEEIAVFKQEIGECLICFRHLIDQGFSDKERKSLTDALGHAGEKYRYNVYEGFSGEHKKLDKANLLGFYEIVLKYLDQSISVNRRPDGLYHSYNLLQFGKDSIAVSRLYLMLEGQVAILNSGVLTPEDNLKLISALFASDLWRSDQQSFMLYPFRELPGFLEKNIIPANLVMESRLLCTLISKGDTRIVKQDDAGIYHFNAGLKNARLLSDILSQLQDTEPELTEDERDRVLDIYETVFNHRAFTGRSGSFYKYEGLGSIYWHMVSKLLLALGENIMEFVQDDQCNECIAPLRDYYYRIREGIGVHKEPGEYGAFPTDPYSHTPSMMGVQQPGMTGQVKEDIISRFGELGVVAKDAQLAFNPSLLRKEEFLSEETFFEYDTVNGVTQQIRLGKGQLAFTYCSVPIIYSVRKEQKITIHYADGKTEEINGNRLPRNLSKLIFMRSGNISRLEVSVWPKTTLK